MEPPTQRTLLLDAVVLFTTLLGKERDPISEFERNTIQTWIKLAEKVLYPPPVN